MFLILASLDAEGNQPPNEGQETPKETAQVGPGSVGIIHFGCSFFLATRAPELLLIITF